jgi:exopolysaccharide biosynthesis polyprenyl glycosylphosphotransferase
MLAVADTLGAVCASLSLGIFGGGLDAVLWAAAFVPVWILLAKLHGLYDGDHRALRHLTVDEFPGLFMWSLTATVAVAVLLVVTPVGSLSISDALGMWLVALPATFLLRAGTRSLWRRITPPERAVVIGEGQLAEETQRKLELFPDIHVTVAGQRETFTPAEVEASPSWLADADRVILASQSVDEEQIAALVDVCRREQLKLSVVPPARGVFGTAVQLNHVADLPVIEYNTWDVSRSTELLKRSLDLAVSLPLLVLSAPLFAAIAIAIRVDSPGRVVFSQRRAGRHGVPFRMFKFRTMSNDAEERLGEVVALDDLRDPMFKLRRDPRVTRVGRFLRRTSLDELPQLFNILRGEMSLVGPRPEQIELTERYRPEHLFRLTVKPGLTGPMQVYGRGELSFDERLAVEREYIENLSLSRDLRILALTLTAVVSGKGAF